MKISAIIVSGFLIAIFSSCDLRSGIAKDNMEKYTSTPPPAIVPPPAEAPVDPSDIIEVDITLEGELISINSGENKKTAVCAKFNRVMLNGHENKVTITGACRQIMINGDRNEITADAAMEFIFNGSGNSLRYSRFANGNRPRMIENRAGNVIEKMSAERATGNVSPRKL